MIWLPLSLMTCLFWSNGQQTDATVAAQAIPAIVKKPEEIKFKQASFTGRQNE